MQRSGSKFSLLVCLAVASLATACSVIGAGTADTSAHQNISAAFPDFAGCLAEHLATHPDMTAQDVYKFVHQSVAGPGHLIPSKEQALAYLQREIADLEEAPGHEPLYEELGGELDLVRLNLRPYVRRGGDAQRLVEAMQITAAAVSLDIDEMSRRLRLAADLMAQRGLDRDRDALVRLREEYASQGYPALHHSERYSAAYRPAYRVISRRQADMLAGDLSSEKQM